MVLESNTLDLLFVKDGEQGTDGKMLYTWIKYAKDDKGTDMTDDPQSAVYIGISYNNESNVESDDPTQYAWTKIQGADGKKGEDAYTIVLENENISFATDENRNPLSEQAYTSRITVMKGATPVTDFGIGDIAKTQGIAIAKGDDGISISVVNGNALPADSGEITVPISVGGTVFKKVLTWTCAKKGEQGVKGDKGDTGQKGQDGTSVKITSKSVTYQTSTSGTTAPTGTWSTTVPTVNNGQYLWTKTTVQYSDGNKTEAYSVSYKGTNGTNGTSVTVSKTEITYQVSTSGTTAPTGTWSTTMPSCDQGQYLWTKTYVKYSDGKETTSYSVSYKGVDGEKFAFNMLRETNQGSKHWVNMGASGKYSVESITTEDSINAVKLICTEPIASNEWQFCDFSDYEMLKSLKASTTYTLSYDIKTNRSGKILHNIKTGGGQKLFFANDIACKVLGNETWEHVSLKMTSGTTLPNLDGQVIYMFGDALSKVGYSIIKNLKLTEGIVDTPWAPHPEDLEGRGVTEITQWYLATNLSSGVTAGTSGWSTDITTQKITADKKYLWNCHRTKYSDGTMTLISTPAIIGVYGDKGDNAKNLTITPSSQYFKSTDGGKTFAPNAITIKATIQGEINFGKWQYSIDGGVSFADIVSGQKGLTISNNALTVSKDSSLYSDAVTMVTFRAVASDSSFYDTCSVAKIYDVSDIGDGRNLWITRDNITLQACEKDKYIYTTTGTSTVCIGADGSSVGTNTIALQTGTKYTISFVISSPSEVGNAKWYFCTALNRTGVKNYGGYGVKLVTGENIVSQTITVDTSCDAAGLVLYHLPTGCVIKDIQVEKGSSPTGWTPAPEDLQTAILSTKNSIDSVSSKVDTNTKSIQDKVSKTTYERELTLVKGDLSKANEGLNKWRYEIYPKSLFDSADQGKSTIDIFAKNLNLVPSQTVLLDDASLSTGMGYGDNHIAYALTFVKMSAKKDVTTKMFNDDGASLYVNGGLIITRPSEYTNGEEITFTLAQGWNCIEVVVNEGGGDEGFRFSTTLSKLSECQMMNCYYGTPVARQSRITNQLVDVTKNLNGVTSTVQDVMTAVGNSGNITEFKNNYSKWKQSVDKIETRVGEKYVTNEKFNGLEIGGRNLLTKDDCNMSKWQNLYPAHCKITSNDYLNHVDYVPTGNEWEIVYKKISVTKGQKYILSFDYKINKAYNYLSGQKYGVYLSTSVPTNAAPANIITNGQYVIENTVTNIKRGMITFTAAVDTLYIVINGGCIDDNQTGLSFEFNKWKLEKGNKATDWTPAPEDNEINGQNLVSNLPDNWEQGGFDDGKTNIGCDYATNKTSMTTRIRCAELIPVSGQVTISNAYANSQKPIQYWITAFDVNKKWLGKDYVSTAWTNFPATVDMKDAKYLAIMVGYTDSSAITPSDISQICLKVERGTSATPFTLAPEDVNGKIVNVETIANQTAKKFEWIVNGESTSSNLVLTDNALTAIANNINLTGKVTFNSFDQSLKDTINNKMNVSYLKFSSGGNKQGFFKIATLQMKQTHADQNIIFGVNHREHGYTECRIRFSNAGNTDPGMGSFKQTGTPTRAWRIIKTATSTWDLYLAKTDSWDGGRVIKFDNPYEGGLLVTWSGASADLPDGAIIAEQMIADQTTIDGGIITTGYISADRIAASSITADKIATDAIKSRNYISSGGMQGSFLNLSDGSFTSPNLSWDSNGNLIASNANLSGLINATKGTVGGWNIATNGLYSGIDENAIKIYSATTYDAQTMYQKQKIQDSFILSQKYINHFVSQQVSVGHNIPYWQTRSFIYNDSQIQLAQSDYCINTSSASNYDAQYSLKDGYISATRIYMEQNITQVGGDVINSSFSIGLDSMMGWCSIQSTKGINIYGNSSRALYVQSNDTSKYNALETEGDVVVNGKIHAVSGDNKIQLNSDNNGSIELYGNTPFIDFHSAYSSADYTCRIIANTPEQLLVCGKLRCDSNIISNNDLIANSWVYAGQNAHYTWQNQLDCYFSCGYYNNTNNVYYYAGYHAFYVNGDSGSGMMYIETSGVSSRKGFRNSSDERIKQNFSHFDDNFIDTYMSLEPVQYQFKNDTNDKYHFGFKAQQTERILNAYGQESDKSYGICATHAINPEKAEKLYGVKDMHEEYTLAYDELIAPTTYMVQHTYKELESTKDELAKVKQEKENLEARLQAIEAKLGL